MVSTSGLLSRGCYNRRVRKLTNVGVEVVVEPEDLSRPTHLNEEGLAPGHVLLLPAVRTLRAIYRQRWFAGDFSPEKDAYMRDLLLEIFLANALGHPLNKKTAGAKMGAEDAKTQRKYIAEAESNQLIIIKKDSRDKRKELIYPTEKLIRLIERKLDEIRGSALRDDHGQPTSQREETTSSPPGLIIQQGAMKQKLLPHEERGDKNDEWSLPEWHSIDHEYVDTLNTLRESLRKNSRDIHCRARLAAALCDAGHLEAAYEQSERVLAINPRHRLALLTRARINSLREQWQAASCDYLTLSTIVRRKRRKEMLQFAEEMSLRANATKKE